LVLADEILPVSCVISQARRTSVHHSLCSGPLALPMKRSKESKDTPANYEVVDALIVPPPQAGVVSSMSMMMRAPILPRCS
jgi:hypothetical protein